MIPIEIGIVVIIVLNILALFLIRKKPATGRVPFTPEGLRPAHSPHVHVVRRKANGEAERVRQLKGGTLDPANHAEIGAALSSGPDCGIEWNAGNVEWGTHGNSE